MFFTSYNFMFFFLALALVYFTLPFRWRWILLLAGSYFFYGCWGVADLFLLIAQTTVVYCGARLLEFVPDPRRRRTLLVFILFITLGSLFIFKYFNFFGASLGGFLSFLGVRIPIAYARLALPAGISFYTFQLLGYIIDVYRGQLPAERHFGRFALFVSFFPQILAGPIARAGQLLPQFDREHHFDLERIASGSKLILWGLFKKMVIADRLALYVNLVYHHPQDFSGSTLLLASYFFAFQIYCDFSGYSDIAIGLGRVLGFELMQNFNLPYLARNVREFWSRWHISLSTWFRDYVYIALGGNRGVPARWAFNIMITFLLSGLWHGANWTYLAWGALHGAYYLGGRFTHPVRDRLSGILGLRGRPLAILQVLVTFHLLLLSWVFFRAESLGDALFIIRAMVTGLTRALYLGPSQLATMLSILFVGILILVQWFQARGSASLYFSKSRLPVAVRWVAYILMIFGILVFGVGSNAFIYFQF